MAQGMSGLGRLPHRDSDPVLRLLVHYYYPADLMRVCKDKLAGELARRGRLSERKERDYGIYFRLWLALLYVVCEQLNDEAESQLLNRPSEFVKLWSNLQIALEHFRKHEGSLRVFRNGQF